MRIAKRSARVSNFLARTCRRCPEFGFFRCLLIGVLLTTSQVSLAQTANPHRYEDLGNGPADRWLVGAEVYLWGANIGGESAAGDSIDIGFDTLIKDLEFGFMGTLAATRDKWSLAADLIYLDVSDDIQQAVNLPMRSLRAEADIELQGFISTLGGAYRFYQTDRTHLNLTLGARYLWLDVSVKGNVDELFAFRFSDSGSVWDGVIGLRGKTNLNPRWYLTYYGDIGTGDSESTAQALVAINYRCNRIDFVGGYRYMEWDFDGAPYFDELDLSGVFAGVKFTF